MTVIAVIDGSCDTTMVGTQIPDAQIMSVQSFLDLPFEIACLVSAIVLRSGAGLGAPELDRMPRLRHVVRPGSGTDNIDLGELDQRGIRLHRNPEVSAQAVAEWTLLAALALSRRAALGHSEILAGRHAKALCQGQSLIEANTAIWGAGPVGRAVERALRPHVAAAAFARWPSNSEHLPQRHMSDLEGWADLHVVALPLTTETRGFFAGRFIAAVSSRAPLLVCVGRLETLDVRACLAAVADGRLGGLAIDPIDPEQVPLFTDLKRSNVFLTPHIGAQRTDIRATLDRWVADVLLANTLGILGSPA